MGHPYARCERPTASHRPVQQVGGSEQVKVITVDRSVVEYHRKLSELTVQVHKIGTNYNQVVRLMHLYTAEKSIQALLRELIGLTKELTALQEKAVSLTIDYRERL